METKDNTISTQKKKKRSWLKGGIVALIIATILFLPPWWIFSGELSFLYVSPGLFLESFIESIFGGVKLTNATGYFSLPSPNLIGNIVMVLLYFTLGASIGAVMDIKKKRGGRIATTILVVSGSICFYLMLGNFSPEPLKCMFVFDGHNKLNHSKCLMSHLFLNKRIVDINYCNHFREVLPGYGNNYKYERSNCIRTIANRLREPGLCDKITNENTKRECSSELKKRIMEKKIIQQIEKGEKERSEREKIKKIGKEEFVFVRLASNDKFIMLLKAESKHIYASYKIIPLTIKNKDRSKWFGIGLNARSRGKNMDTVEDIFRKEQVRAKKIPNIILKVERITLGDYEYVRIKKKGGIKYETATNNLTVDIFYNFDYVPESKGMIKDLEKFISIIKYK